jgi:peptide/nickel transport system ATP-binding protein
MQGNPQLESVGDSRSVRCVRGPEQVVLAIKDRSLELPEIKAGSPLLRVEDVWCAYGSRRNVTSVVRGVTFEVAQAETLAIVGESGSGKSTLTRAIAGLHSRSSGSIRFEGLELAADAAKRQRAVRRDMQIVFQNPDMSLNPRHDVMSLIARPMQLFEGGLSRREREQRVRELLLQVNLPQSMAHRYPGELSGGQKQRVAIARAFAANPKLILADEITSALDVSVQAAILSLLSALSAERGTSVVFVSHDLAVVRAVAHRALVLQQGEVREMGNVGRLFEFPEHEYTRELVNAIPTFGASA